MEIKPDPKKPDVVSVTLDAANGEPKALEAVMTEDYALKGQQREVSGDSDSTDTPVPKWQLQIANGVIPPSFTSLQLDCIHRAAREFAERTAEITGPALGDTPKISLFRSAVVQRALFGVIAQEMADTIGNFKLAVFEAEFGNEPRVTASTPSTDLVRSSPEPPALTLSPSVPPTE